MFILGIFVFLLVIVWMIAISGLNNQLMAVWILVPLPLGAANLIEGSILKRRSKKAGIKQYTSIATINIFIGILDILLGLTPWVVYFFFFRWISP